MIPIVLDSKDAPRAGPKIARLRSEWRKTAHDEAFEGVTISEYKAGTCVVETQLRRVSRLWKITTEQQAPTMIRHVRIHDLWECDIIL